MSLGKCEYGYVLGIVSGEYVHYFSRLRGTCGALHGFNIQ